MAHSAKIQPVRVQTKDLHLSGLLAVPEGTDESAKESSRGLIVALHGGGYSAGYWNCPVDGASLLELGAHLGFHVLALDRPGYGAAEQFDPSRLRLAAQVELLFDAIEAWEAKSRFHGPTFIIGHSIGGMLALLMAAHVRGTRLSGIDVLGVPLRFSTNASGDEVQSWQTGQSHLPVLREDLRKSLLFGPPHTYSAAADEYDRTLVRPMPATEYLDGITLPGTWERVLPSIKTPVQFTSAELETMQITGSSVLDEVRQLLRASIHCVTHLQRASGHNASTHRVARAYHLRAIAFFEECRALGE